MIPPPLCARSVLVNLKIVPVLATSYATLDFTRGNCKKTAPVTYRSGKLNSRVTSIPHKIREIDFCDCLASDLGWYAARGAPWKWCCPFSQKYRIDCFYVQRKLLHKCSAITSMTQLCSNSRCPKKINTCVEIRWASGATWAISPLYRLPREPNRGRDLMSSPTRSC